MVATKGKRYVMNKSITIKASLMAAAVVLSACSVLPKPPATATLYDLGPAISKPVDLPVGKRPVMMAAITGEGLIPGSTAMLYRFAQEDQQLRAYQEARWSRSIEQLVGLQLRQKLEQGRPVLDTEFSVSRIRTGELYPLVLRVDIENFEQIFKDAQQSKGVVQLRATLMEPSATGDKLLAQRTFVSAIDAPEANAAGGAQALAIASRHLAEEIDNWLRQYE